MDQTNQYLAKRSSRSANGPEQSFEKNKLLGDADDHAFHPPNAYYYAAVEKRNNPLSGDIHPFPDDVLVLLMVPVIFRC